MPFLRSGVIDVAAAVAACDSYRWLSDLEPGRDRDCEWWLCPSVEKRSLTLQNRPGFAVGESFDPGKFNVGTGGADLLV